MKKRICVLVLLSVAFSGSAFAMGIRAFVALPLEQGGIVFRLQDFGTFDGDKNTAIGNFLTGSQENKLSS